LKARKITISPSAIFDIQEATDWYNKRLPKLGSRFQLAVKRQIGALKNNAEGYKTKYQDVHCMLVKKFPYLIHFTIDETNRIIEVFAVIHTSRSPEIWDEKRNTI
jgi:mRNA-degrading endonuclease RelE of RelBE toxin-antitoxin system